LATTLERPSCGIPRRAAGLLEGAQITLSELEGETQSRAGRKSPHSVAELAPEIVRNGSHGARISAESNTGKLAQRCGLARPWVFDGGADLYCRIANRTRPARSLTSHGGGEVLRLRNPLATAGGRKAMTPKRHATAVVLIGWYLMVPAVFDPQKGKLTADAAAPLSRWQIKKSFDTAADCETERVGVQAQGERMKTEAGESRALAISAAMAACISTEDPRLAK
jgi:hypothetical protein